MSEAFRHIASFVTSVGSIRPKAPRLAVLAIALVASGAACIGGGGGTAASGAFSTTHSIDNAKQIVAPNTGTTCGATWDVSWGLGVNINSKNASIRFDYETDAAVSPTALWQSVFEAFHTTAYLAGGKSESTSYQWLVDPSNPGICYGFKLNVRLHTHAIDCQASSGDVCAVTALDAQTILPA